MLEKWYLYFVINILSMYPSVKRGLYCYLQKIIPFSVIYSGEERQADEHWPQLVPGRPHVPAPHEWTHLPEWQCLRSEI